MAERIGFIIPEFPGQTHIFLWRERQALAELGIEADLVSTFHPPQSIASHSWAVEAREQTRYLLPMGGDGWRRALWQVLRAGPVGWWRVIASVLAADDLTLRQRARLLAMTVVAGKLIWFARQREWSHIHAHSCADSANIAMLAFLLSGIPYSMTLHGPTLDGYGPNQRQKWRHAAFATVISHLLQSVVDERLAGERPALMLVAPMGVDLAQIKRAQPYEHWREGAPCRLFSCGRLNPVKGYVYLLGALELLRGHGIDARLEIAGEDEQGGVGYRRTLEAVIADRGLDDCVTLLGAVPESRVREGLERAHVFVLASLNEGVSVAIMEALAMEMPVVATDVGGNFELIDTGIDALLVPSESPEALAEAVRAVLYEPGLADRLRHASRPKVAARFHHRVSAKALAECLRLRS